MTDAAKPTILAIVSQSFNSDLTALIQRGTRFQWMLVTDDQLMKAQKEPWIPQEARLQSDYVRATGQDVEAGWEKSKNYAVQYLNDLRTRCNLVAVLSGNWDDWQDEGFRRACNELNIPFLVLYRELHLAATDRIVREGYYEDIVFKPNVAGVAMAGPSSADLMTACNFFSKDIVRITGWPRFDPWISPVTPVFDRPIMLMSYLKGYFAGNHFLEMLRHFAAAANRHPHIPFVLKAKHRGEVAQLKQMLAELGARVEVIDTTVMSSLMPNARAVIGFNSLSMFEALLTDAQILLPQWGDARINPARQAPSPADDALRPHMRFLESAEELHRAIDQAATATAPAVNRAGRLSVFSSIFRFSPEQTATERVENFITEFTTQRG